MRTNAKAHEQMLYCSMAMGVFLVTTKNAFFPVERVYSAREHIRDFQLFQQGNQRSECSSP